MFLCTRTRLLWTTVPRRVKYLFGFLTLAYLAISVEFNMDFVATLLISDGKFPHNKMRTSANTKTIAIYVCNDLHNEMQIRNILELHSYFDKDLFVVTDKTDFGDDWILPAEQVISPYSNVTLSTKTMLSVCCGIERSIMWLILNQDYYNCAWIMEDDIAWSNFTDLKDFFHLYSLDDDTDLLHSNYGMEEHTFYDLERWWGYKRLLPPYVQTENAKFYPPFHEGTFQFYRLSSRFVAALNDWRLKNNGEWTFFEPLLANLAFRNDTATNLTSKNYINNSIGYDFRIKYRPCYSMEQVYNTTSNGGRGGLFHPVKKDASSKDCRLQDHFVLQEPYVKPPQRPMRRMMMIKRML
jgi:hypothetical protein